MSKHVKEILNYVSTVIYVMQFFRDLNLSVTIIPGSRIPFSRNFGTNATSAGAENAFENVAAE